MQLQLLSAQRASEIEVRMIERKETFQDARDENFEYTLTALTVLPSRPPATRTQVVVERNKKEKQRRHAILFIKHLQLHCIVAALLSDHTAPSWTIASTGRI